jgi:hypothetical protein
LVSARLFGLINQPSGVLRAKTGFGLRERLDGRLTLFTPHTSFASHKVKKELSEQILFSSSREA